MTNNSFLMSMCFSKITFFFVVVIFTVHVFQCSTMEMITTTIAGINIDKKIVMIAIAMSIHHHQVEEDVIIKKKKNDVIIIIVQLVTIIIITMKKEAAMRHLCWHCPCVHSCLLTHRQRHLKLLQRVCASASHRRALQKRHQQLMGSSVSLIQGFAN